ncbi:MAG: ankyrin repeat domain-containing protein [Pseudomonadota bacterium]
MRRRFRFFGKNAELTPIGKMIMEEDIAALDATLAKEWQLDEPVSITPRCRELAISVALVENKLKVVDYLLSKGVELNTLGQPAICFAASGCDKVTIEKLIDAGANIKAENTVGSNAFSRALYSDRIELLPVFLENGLPVDADGGKSFRQAVFNGRMDAVKFFLAEGMDPNLRTPDMVHPSNPTAVHVAAENDNFAMVKLLVSHGADVTLDSNGGRPFHAAVANQNSAMIDFIRDLEPPEWHDLGIKLKQLQSLGLSENLLEFLQREDRKIPLNTCGCSWIELLPLLCVTKSQWQDEFVVQLMADLDDSCSCGSLVWSPGRKKLAFIDIEHDETTWLEDWDAFITNPNLYVEKQFE